MARLDRRSGRDVHRQAPGGAQRGSLDDLLEEGDGGLRGYHTERASNGQGQRDLGGLTRRLETLSSRLDQLSDLANSRRNAQRQPVETGGGLGETLNRLSERLDSMEKTARSTGWNSERDRSEGENAVLDVLDTLDDRVNAIAGRAGEAGSRTSRPRSREADRAASRLDTDMRSAVAEIARRQRELDVAPGRRPAERPHRQERPETSRPIASGELNRALERHIAGLAEEIGALRTEVANQAASRNRGDGLSQIKDIARNIETLIDSNPNPSAIDTIRDEIAALRETVVSGNSVDAAVESLRDGYENILHRLENLQSSVGDPRLYHSIADRLGEVRQALGAIPQLEQASGLERRLTALADQLDSVGARVNSLPFDHLQNQVFELQNALQSISPRDAIKGLEWKLKSIGEKIDALEHNISHSGEVNDRVASLEDLIRSQPAPAEVVDRLDRLHDLFLERNGYDAVRELERRIAALADKLDIVGGQDVAGDTLTALDVRVAELCARFEKFSGQFGAFAGNQSADAINGQIEAIAERIEVLAETIADGRVVEPVRNDIAALRKQLADGDRAVVDLADRIGRIGDRLDRFLAFDSDGRLARLADELVTLQKQIADGDTVVFEILKRVGNLESKLDGSATGGERDPELIAREIAGIRDRLVSGDEMLNRVVDRMESLLSSIDAVASAPGLLSELAPAQKDFAALHAELSEGNQVARDVLAGLKAIDGKLDSIAADRPEESDLARLYDELATLRDVVQATDSATLTSLNDQIGNLAARLDRIPQDGGGEAAFDNLEKQIDRLADKLAATESQLGSLAMISERLDQLDERILSSSEETRSALRAVAGSGSRASAADDPSVIALQSDLKRLQESAVKTDTSFGAVQAALTGIAERLSSLESDYRAAPEDDESHAPEVRPVAQERTARSPRTPEIGGVTREPQPSGAAPAPDDHRPLEPGSGKPSPAARGETADAVGQKTPGRRNGEARPRPSGDRAEFLAAARRAARQAAVEASAGAPAGETPAKKGWLARAASLRNRMGESAPKEGRREPRMAKGELPAERAAASAAPAAAAGEDGNKSSLVRKYGRALMIAALGIAVIVAGLQIFNFFVANSGGGIATYSGEEAEPGDKAHDPAAATGSGAQEGAPEQEHSEPRADEDPDTGSADAPDVTFAPPSGAAGSFGQTGDDSAPAGALGFFPEPRQIETVPGATAEAVEANLAPVTTEADPADPAGELPEEEAGPLALREAAASGDVFAQFEVASRYMEGRGVTQNLPKAVEWYSKAAGQDFAPAQYRLGSMFEKGLGIPKDLQSARSWYTRAADKGNAKAIHNLAVLHAEGGLGERNFGRAAQWFKQAAGYGVTDSQYNLGILYAQGLGVERDLGQSYKWFALAAKAGDVDAARKRDAVAAELGEDEKSRILLEIADWKPMPIDAAANHVPAIPAEWRSGVANGSTAAGPAATLGTSEAAISQAQRLLTQRGYAPGPADGKLGPQTQDAIRSFQKDAGLPVTGEVDAALITALGGDSI